MKDKSSNEFCGLFIIYVVLMTLFGLFTWPFFLGKSELEINVLIDAIETREGEDRHPCEYFTEHSVFGLSCCYYRLHYL